MKNNNDVKLIIFDLGGVLVELGEQLFPSSWMPNNADFGLDEWFASSVAASFETGKISTQTFISELKQSLSIKASDEEVLTAFEYWPKGLLPHADELLRRLKVNYKLAVLSNTNEVHEPRLLNGFDLQSKVDDIFFSHKIGYSKPDPAAFDYVLKSLDVRPNEVVFFDDNMTNVLAARALGILAYQVSSPLAINEIMSRISNVSV